MKTRSERMNTLYPGDIDLGAIVDVFAQGDPRLRDPAIRRLVVRGADALLREFEAEMAAKRRTTAPHANTHANRGGHP
jgi:hypothetical protein